MSNENNLLTDVNTEAAEAGVQILNLLTPEVAAEADGGCCGGSCHA